VKAPEAPLPAGVACERTYQVLVDGEAKPVVCRWLVPLPHPRGGGWTCEGRITWPDGRVRAVAIGGYDPVQALWLSLMFVSSELLASPEPVYLSEIDDDLHLPVADAFIDMVAERKARFETP
jgi:hypothetical protein